MDVSAEKDQWVGCVDNKGVRDRDMGYPLIRPVTHKSFKGNSILPMKQRFKSTRMGCASPHSNLKRPGRVRPTGLAIKHFPFSHSERRGLNTQGENR